MERVDGIEPTYPAWKASVLPLNYTRKMGREGFEPSKRKRNRFTVCPRWPLGYLPLNLHHNTKKRKKYKYKKPGKGIEPSTY
jgi:hypothetical protein